MFDFKLSLSSFRLCRRRTGSVTTNHLFSPFNPKTLEITYPVVPSPPPTTPEFHNSPVSFVSDQPAKTDDENVMYRKVMEETLTVVRWSEHPQDDFKKSMLEMILEKQMFEAKDLEELLQCFLTLNSRDHHANIVAAFTEIWELLFR
ncbi:hypothetical protein QVD17_39115 [Tagetes erecta]|uniref:Transcription repressor n=1 Tax=Tagetes erecta TaxID=13708 RepID=A0AAD8JN00_TARER|nr:hypothetical protein QVD17_39115 [Tagetes erecta]